MDTRYVIEELCEVLTSKLVSRAGVTGPHNVVLWASGELGPSEHEEKRLHVAHAAFRNMDTGQCRQQSPVLGYVAQSSSRGRLALDGDPTRSLSGRGGRRCCFDGGRL